MNLYLISGAHASGKTKLAGTLRGALGSISDILVIEEAQCPTPQDVIDLLEARYKGARFETVIVVETDAAQAEEKGKIILDTFPLTHHIYRLNVERLR